MTNLRQALLILLISLMASSAFGARQVIDTLGSSGKGQFVALEEYGYAAEKHNYIVTIKIMNVWQKEYVGEVIKVELPAYQQNDLQKARERARVLAQNLLNKYGINSPKS
jgi:predicted secreted protein